MSKRLKAGISKKGYLAIAIVVGASALPYVLSAYFIETQFRKAHDHSEQR